MCCGNNPKRRITQSEQKPQSQPAQKIGSTNQQVSNYNAALEAQKASNQATNTKKIYR